jgi:hypothetical protein
MVSAANNALNDRGTLACWEFNVQLDKLISRQWCAPHNRSLRDRDECQTRTLDILARYPHLNVLARVRDATLAFAPRANAMAYEVARHCGHRKKTEYSLENHGYSRPQLLVNKLR